MNSTNLTQEIDRMEVSEKSSEKNVDVSDKDDDEEEPFLSEQKVRDNSVIDDEFIEDVISPHEWLS